MTDSLYLLLSIALLLVIISLFIVWRLWRAAVSDLKESRSNNQSLSTRYGKISEQFMPFISNYPWDPQDFRFLGSPIDGIQFENDKIILVEFKTASSTFSKRQRVIREQVERGLVEFKEFRLE